MDAILIFTMDIGGSAMRCKKSVSVQFNADNGLLENLRKYSPKDAKVLFITGCSDQPDYNDYLIEKFKNAFEKSQMSYTSFDIWDFRSTEKDLSQYNFLLLGSGSTTAHIEFYNKINLKEKLKNFKGLIVTLEGSTDTCCDNVYDDPEVCSDKPFERAGNGLGITKLTIFPKLNYSEEQYIQKTKNMVDVKQIYLLDNKSYIIQKGNDITLYGKAYLFENNKLTQICKLGETLDIKI